MDPVAWDAMADNDDDAEREADVEARVRKKRRRDDSSDDSSASSDEESKKKTKSAKADGPISLRAFFSQGSSDED